MNIKVELGDGRALGPGKIRLLELIDEKGSIRGAAIAMDMSYRRAWLLLHDVEDMMGAPVLAAETGGRKGGGTSLTTAGRAVVGHYRSIEAIAARSIDTELKALARLAKRPSAGAANSKPKRPRTRKHQV
ncbi:MAG TPA: LysR family transcriptional regulator [Rhizomicrobium sp.]|nr:LysR family transcriptional regulator [Rhizomicrobium sp.]